MRLVRKGGVDNSIPELTIEKIKEELELDVKNTTASGILDQILTGTLSNDPSSRSSIINEYNTINKNAKLNDIELSKLIEHYIQKQPDQTQSRSSYQDNSAAFDYGVGKFGGSNKQTLKKYKEKLKNKTLVDLQKIAKNKKIKITKKYNGKISYIKKATLIKNLCNLCNLCNLK